MSYETAKDRTAQEPPAHIELMKNLELVDYEPGSDAGNFRWPPRGNTLKRAIEERVTKEMVDYGGRRQFSVADLNGYVIAFTEAFAER